MTKKIKLDDSYLNHHEWTKAVKINKKGRLLLEKIDLTLDDNAISEYDRKQLMLDKKIIVNENRHGFLFYLFIFFLILTIFGCVFIPVIW